MMNYVQIKLGLWDKLMILIKGEITIPIESSEMISVKYEDIVI